MRSLGLRVAVGGALAAMAIAGWTACSIYGTDLLLPAPGDDASADAAIDVAPPDVAPPDADTCGHARWPARPASDDPSTTPSVEVIAALATLDIGVEKDGGAPPPGFDLDGVCTCPGPDSCRNTATTKPHCDNAAGGDNSGGALLAALGSFGAFNSLTLNENLTKGLYGLLIAIRSWNGQPNDTSVTVAMFVSNGLSGIEDGGAVGPVKGDGTDRWTIDPGTLLGGTNLVGIDCDNDNTQCAPAYFDDNAYVADGQLVGSFDFPIALGGLGSTGTVVVDLSGSTISARLVQESGRWGLGGGVLAGRWASAKLLTSLAALRDPLSSGNYLCGDDPTYLGVKNQICNAADITTDPKTDNTGAPCNALSIAIGFSALPAHMGEVYDKGPVVTGCVGDAGTPFHDQCGP